MEGHRRYADDAEPSRYSGKRSYEDRRSPAAGPYDSGVQERPSGAFRLPEQRPPGDGYPAPYGSPDPGTSTGSHARPGTDPPLGTAHEAVRLPIRGPEYPTVRPNGGTSPADALPAAAPASAVPAPSSYVSTAGPGYGTGAPAYGATAASAPISSGYGMPTTGTTASTGHRAPGVGAPASSGYGTPRTSAPATDAPPPTAYGTPAARSASSYGAPATRTFGSSGSPAATGYGGTGAGYGSTAAEPAVPTSGPAVPPSEAPLPTSGPPAAYDGPAGVVPPSGGVRPERVYRARRPVSSILVAAVTAVLMIPALMLLVEATFGGDVTARGVVPAVLLTLGLPLTGTGLFALAGGGPAGREAWLRPPLAYLPIGLLLLVASGLGVA